MSERYNDLLILSDAMKIEKNENPAVNLQCKKYIRNLKHAINHQFILKIVHRVIKCNKEALLKPYIDMKAELKNAKNYFKKDFLKLLNNTVFWKTMGNVRKYKDINLVTTEARMNYLFRFSINLVKIYLVKI